MIHDKVLEFYEQRYKEKFAKHGLPEEFRKYGMSIELAAKEAVYRKWIRYHAGHPETLLYHNFKALVQKNKGKLETRTNSAFRYYDSKQKVEYIVADQKLTTFDKIGNPTSVFYPRRYIYELPVFSKHINTDGEVEEDESNIVATTKNYELPWTPANVKSLRDTYFYDNEISHTTWHIVGSDGRKWSISQEQFENEPRDKLLDAVVWNVRKPLAAG